MARGSTAKIEVSNKIAKAFGSNYIGEVGGKHYVWADDGGERVQIALAMTCPKVMVECEAPAAPASDCAWGAVEVKSPPSSTEITQEEKDNIERLKNILDSF